MRHRYQGALAVRGDAQIESRRTEGTSVPRFAAVLGATLSLVLAGCADDDTAPPDINGQADLDDADDADDHDEEPTEIEPEAEPDDDPVADDAAPDEDAPDNDAPEGDEGAEMLAGEPSTETAEADGEAGSLAVTEVRVGTHDGFDRIVFELEGDGAAGWFIRYDDEPTSQGSGEPIEVDGEAALAIAIHNVALPPDLPDDVEVWDASPLAGPEGGVVVEVVSDTIFEGIHTFVAGTTGEHAFLVERFDEPHRVVIDIVHDG